MAQGIILAGGYAKRANQNKLIWPLKDKSIIVHTICSMASFVDAIIVVTGFYHHDIVQTVKDLKKVKIVHNPNYALGMFTSVQCGVRAVNDDFFIIPGDYPLVNPETYALLLNSSGLIRVPTFQSRRGHPIWIDKSLRQPLLDMPSDANLKMFRDQYPMTEVACSDEGILIDIDTEEVYTYIKNQFERKSEE